MLLKFLVLLLLSLSIYFDGRDKVKNKSKKELEKMTIKDDYKRFIIFVSLGI
ncbi:hypothetical protein [Clostridium combesii]|uniref:hypothetical protein n=1 Tax=Clostridium combesii TaxID=39481 RepID=UPI0013FDB7AE|nr:hypothetical protein [Clostridium combesii]